MAEPRLRELARTRIDDVLAAAVAAHVFAVILAQTKVFDLLRFGLRLRWLTLAILVVLALAAVAAHGRDRRVRLEVPLVLAGALLALALVSRGWTAAPSEVVFSIPDNLGTNRALAIGSLLVAAAALAAAGRARAVSHGVVAGATLVALAGLVVLGFDRDAAVEPATAQYGARFNGLGGNPNTAASLEALAVPLALGLALAATPRRRIAFWSAVVALLACSVTASASRGGMLAAAVGSLVCVAAIERPRRRLVAAAGVVALSALALVVSQAPDPDPAAAPQALPADRAPPPAPPSPNPFDVQQQRPLQDDVGWTTDFRRTLLGSGGRAAALRGAVEQALGRPVLGYGFGYEEKVFTDRYAVFNAARPENAYIGTMLQLGLVGLLLLLALVVSLVASARGPAFSAVAPFVAVVAAGAVLGLSQSFVLAAGSSATAAFWLCAFAIAAAAANTAKVR